jgi:hypothetical protein
MTIQPLLKINNEAGISIRPFKEGNYFSSLLE